MDIGDAEFTDLTNYRFAIDAVPEWLGGSTAIPTEYFALYLTLTLLWMAFSFMVGSEQRYQIVDCDEGFDKICKLSVQ